MLHVKIMLYEKALLSSFLGAFFATAELPDFNGESSVETEALLRQFVHGKRDGDHRNRSQVIDAHAAVKSSRDAVLLVDEAQRGEHVSSGETRPV